MVPFLTMGRQHLEVVLGCATSRFRNIHLHRFWDDGHCVQHTIGVFLGCAFTFPCDSACFTSKFDCSITDRCCIKCIRSLIRQSNSLNILL